MLVFGCAGELFRCLQILPFCRIIVYWHHLESWMERSLLVIVIKGTRANMDAKFDKNVWSCLTVQDSESMDCELEPSCRKHICPRARYFSLNFLIHLEKHYINITVLRITFHSYFINGLFSQTYKTICKCQHIKTNFILLWEWVWHHNVSYNAHILPASSLLTQNSLWH